ncbi:adenine deaminase C-terminal domain-containing protein [Thermoflavimicrobium dichotomicum]|uniref:adenine deaminase n=1 Tax=Thermoflavimicrobium dichotomicum TaxID=46223 RepID=A0A1I3JFT5_9BACL|nr:adenine deaminase C-terminal domain-containing protein [Thermoflavimicrobium dichotomicum]SFI59069.1 adenine deaminase [Thermoflavimicrobium dichotomicum]
MLIRFTQEEQQYLLEVAMGRKKPSLLITGGTVLNVYTGCLERKDIALAGRRIAYIGDLGQSGLDIDHTVEKLDLTGYVLVPGYIEPHAHPTQVYNPFTFVEKISTLGTTTVINDNLFFFSMWDLDEIFHLLEQLDQYPVKQFWWTRLDSQNYLVEEKKELFSLERVKEHLAHPLVVQAGELTDWPPLLAGDSNMLKWIYTTKRLGKRVEGHSPGASYRTLSRLAAAGVTADHESISVDEVWNRLQLGYMTTLRHSSIRPDLPTLIKGLLQKERVPWHRLMLTTDGATPLYFKEGFQDYVIRLTIEHGCDPIHAYQMVTINPANYYRLDEHIGGLAPGRLADINVLASLQEPTPVMVIAEGEMVAKGGVLTRSWNRMDWSKYRRTKWGSDWRLQECDLPLPPVRNHLAPTIEMINVVITKLSEEPLDVEEGWIKWRTEDDRLLVYLIDPAGKWISSAVLKGFGRGIDGLASSYNGSHDLLVIGRNRNAMVRAANHILEQGGGITWVQDGEIVFHLPLPINGYLSMDSVDQLIEQLEPFMNRLRAFGYAFSDPIYTFLFLSSTHLPQVRLTADGLLRVKEKKIVYPSIKRT